MITEHICANEVFEKIKRKYFHVVQFKKEFKNSYVSFQQHDITVFCH